jgi:hypothetical protein
MIALTALLLSTANVQAMEISNVNMPDFLSLVDNVCLPALKGEPPSAAVAQAQALGFREGPRARGGMDMERGAVRLTVGEKKCKFSLFDARPSAFSDMAQEMADWAPSHVSGYESSRGNAGRGGRFISISSDSMEMVMIQTRESDNTNGIMFYMRAKR